MGDETSDAREQRAKKLASDTAAKATELAVSRALEADRLHRKLAVHDEKLKAINGSIERTAARLQEVWTVVTEIRGEMKSRDRVSEALQEAVDRATKKQVSTREFFLGLAAFVLAIGGLLYGVPPQ